MPLLTLQASHTATADTSTSGTTTLNISRGRLRCVNAFIASGVVRKGETFGVLGLRREGLIAGLLSKGYIYTFNELGWTGDMPIGEDQSLQLVTHSSIAASITIRGVLETL